MTGRGRWRLLFDVLCWEWSMWCRRRATRRRARWLLRSAVPGRTLARVLGGLDVEAHDEVLELLRRVDLGVPDDGGGTWARRLYGLVDGCAGGGR